MPEGVIKEIVVVRRAAAFGSLNVYRVLILPDGIVRTKFLCLAERAVQNQERRGQSGPCQTDPEIHRHCPSNFCSFLLFWERHPGGASPSLIRKAGPNLK